MLDLWPEMAAHKPVLMRAYKAADKTGDGFIAESEFVQLLKMLAVYSNLYTDFSLADGNNDRRLTLAEFKENFHKWAPHLGLRDDASEPEMERLFAEADNNGGGMILFDEFCLFAAQRSGLFDQNSSDQPTNSGAESVRSAADESPKKPTKTSDITRTSPVQMRQWTKEQVHSLFKQFDSTNNNGVLSLAEIDKAVQTEFPDLFTDKRALMRAYKHADKSGDGLVQEKEFAELLIYLDIYHAWSLEFKQMDTDGDKRIDLQEYLHMSKNGSVNSKPAAVLEQEFREIDKNNGGFILFDEFCAYKSQRQAEEIFAGATATSQSRLSSGLKSMKSLFSSGNVQQDSSRLKSPRPVKSPKPAESPPRVKSPPPPSRIKSPVQAERPKSSHMRVKSPPPADNGGLNSLGFPVKLSVDMNLSPAQIHRLFERFDANNNNGVVSLAEIDKTILDLYPEMAKHKRALMRAYKSADVSGDGLIQEKEFAQLLYFLALYDSLHGEFAKMDADGDHRLTFDEFYQMTQRLDKTIDRQQAKAEFEVMDANGGGMVLFEEFCWYRAQARAESSINYSRGSVEMVNKPSTKSKQQEKPRQKVAPKTVIATQSAPVGKEIRAQLSPQELHSLFKQFDYNNNGICSLAEIDKAIRDQFPSIYRHKPAIMRAYKKADVSGDGFVEEREFHELMQYLSYYDQLFMKFCAMDGNSDRRLTLEEFSKCFAEIAGDQHQLSPAQLQTEFVSIDTNGGGMILFDEFCEYMFKRCPPLSDSGNINSNSTVDNSKAAKIKSLVGAVSIETSIPPPLSQDKTVRQQPHLIAPQHRQPTLPPVPEQSRPPSNHRRSSSVPVSQVEPHGRNVLAPLTPNTTVTDSSRQGSVSSAGTSVGAEAVLRAELHAVERRLALEHLEKKRLEASVEILLNQVEELGGSVQDARVLKHRAGVEALHNLNLQLQNKLNTERQLYYELSVQLQHTRGQNRLESLEAARAVMEEHRRARSNQLGVMQKDVQANRLEKMETEARMDDISRKLAVEQEKTRRLTEEVTALKLQVRYQNRAKPV